jgi:epoxyqueuosine reductase
MTERHLSAWIAERASALGFDLCGVVSAEKFPELARTEEWLDRGYAGEMKYLADPRRCDPRTAMPGVKSVIVCALNYNTAQPRSIHAASTEARADSLSGLSDASPRGWISRYAWGSDYHEVLREKLGLLLAELQERCGDGDGEDGRHRGDRKDYSEIFHARIYADTGPVQERILAKYAGLGWLGKNTLLLNQQLGSYFFLGVILTTLEIPPTLPANTAPPPDLCGSCRRCIDACPTNALLEPYVMDARRCISYLTIELRGSIPLEFRELVAHHVFGCDICQDVCPWNNRAPITQAPEFAPREFYLPAAGPALSESPAMASQSLLRPDLEWLAAMPEIEFREVFRGSAIKRTKWWGMVRNACIALGNSGLTSNNPAYPSVTATLQRLMESPEIHVAESAQWALSRIQSQESEHRVEQGSS